MEKIELLIIVKYEIFMFKNFDGEILCMMEFFGNLFLMIYI